MSIQEQLQTDLKTAMRSGDKFRINVIRSARDALQKAQLEAAKTHYAEEARRIEHNMSNDPAARDAALAAISADYHAPLDDQTQANIIAKEAKRRRDTAETYRKVGQHERAEEEEREADILETYLPHQLTPDELRPHIAALIQDMGLSGPAAMGKLMPVLMQQYQGRADGRMLSQLARELLY